MLAEMRVLGCQQFPHIFCEEHIYRHAQYLFHLFLFEETHTFKPLTVDSKLQPHITAYSVLHSDAPMLVLVPEDARVA